MKEFIKYFLGAGKTEEFTNFTLAHFVPIIIAVGSIFLIYFYRDKIKNLKWENNLRLIFAFMMIVCEMSYFWRLIAVTSLNPNPVDHLPITVCGWGVILGSYMLVSKNRTLFDITYFWLFSGTVFALITPTVITYTGPTRYRYYQFWFEHLSGYIAIFYMIFVHGMRPNFKSAVKSYLALLILAIIAYFANDMIGPGANYLFMAKPESTPSILDILPPNFTLRIIVMALVITLMYFLAYLPWLIKDKKQIAEN